MTKGKKIIPYNLNLKMFLPKKKSENKSPQEGANCLHNVFHYKKNIFRQLLLAFFLYINQGKSFKPMLCSEKRRSLCFYEIAPL